MRRDVYIQNDSGGFSVVAADAVDAIIEDGRSDDLRFVSTYKALLLELYGDDSMPVRIVLDEPLSPDEEAQWLARATWRIDTSDGRLIVMGGFDPDVLADWKDDGCEDDGRGVAVVEAAPGSWLVDVYAHAGSMNGRQILNETGEKPGAAFRRSHPARAFPLWLAQMLEFSGERDPGHEDLWQDVRGSIDAGQLAVDTATAGVIGFVVHVTRLSAPADDPPAGGWFDRGANKRVPEIFPLGLPTDARDPDVESFRDRLLGRSAPAEELPVAGGMVEVIEVWSGDPLRPVEGNKPALIPTDAFLLYWIAGLTSDSPPRFELWVDPKGAWTPPAPCAEFAVMKKGRSITAIGPPPDARGWLLWWAARSAAETLAGVPDGSTIDFAMAPRNDDTNPAIGRALYSGPVSGGAWQLTHASPAVEGVALDEALSFVRDLASGRLHVRGGAERDAFEA
ncbi:MAG TPA: hypothetical protein VFV34_15870, partial [Blastocatellia bacterium]|nr:hypothetical protein [Blastocatellia bacterium]